MSKFVKCNKCGCVINDGYYAEGMLWVPENQFDDDREMRGNFDLCMPCYEEILKPYVETKRPNIPDIDISTKEGA